MGVKVGDKIKLLRDDTFGAYKRGDIVNVRGLVDGGVYFDDNDGDGRCASSEWFEPVAVADSNGKERGEFKVGDRVRVVRLGTEDGGSFHSAKIGDEFTVTKIYDEPEAEIHTDKWYFYPHEIEPVAVAPQPQPPLTITAGKFYRTRDGRKVGPAQDRGSYFNLDGWDYNASGICGHGGRANEEDYRRKHDLIAEWTDDPAVPLYDPRTDAFSGTTGFTVPLDAPEFGGGLEGKFKVGDRVETHGDFTFDPGVGTITRVDGNLYVVTVDGHGSGWNYFANELRLVAEATSGKDADAALSVTISADTSTLDAEIDRVKKRLKKLAKRARKMGINLEYGELRDAA